MGQKFSANGVHHNCGKTFICSPNIFGYWFCVDPTKLNVAVGGWRELFVGSESLLSDRTFLLNSYLRQCKVCVSFVCVVLLLIFEQCSVAIAVGRKLRDPLDSQH